MGTNICIVAKKQYLGSSIGRYMDLNEKLEFCKICQNRKFDPKIGIVCLFTDAKPTFINSCPDFVKDKSLVDREAGKTKFKLGQQNQMKYALISIGIVLFAVFRIYLRYERNQRNSRQENHVTFSYPQDNNSVFKSNEAFELSQSDIDILGGVYSQEVDIAISDKIKIDLPKGFYLFPRFHNDQLILIAYSRGFLFTCEKYKKDETLTEEDQWKNEQKKIPSRFPMLPYTASNKLAIYDNPGLLAEIENNFEYIFNNSYRYGHSRIIEHDGFRYYFTLSGTKKNFSMLQQYMRYYVKIRS